MTSVDPRPAPPRSRPDGAEPGATRRAGRASEPIGVSARDRRSGRSGARGPTMTAFEVVVVVLLGLGLAILLNADALVVDARRLPFGDHRDRSLAAWEPVADVAGVLQLTRVREVIDDTFDRGGPLGGSSPGATVAAGPDTGTGTGSDPATTPTDEATTTEAPAGVTTPGDATAPATDDTAPTSSAAAATTAPPATAPPLRTPTAEAPLVTWVGGDSMMQELGKAIVRDAEASGLFTATLDYRISTGLTRPDYFDWPAHLGAELERLAPEVVVIMFGANDSQGIQTPEGDVYQVGDEGWDVEYRRRVAATMDQLEASGVRVYWVGQPPMRDGGFDARMQRLNGIYEAEAATRPSITFVDSVAVLGDANGAFQDLTTVDGAAVDLRQGDGIHLNLDGADLLGDAVLSVVRADAGIPAG